MMSPNVKKILMIGGAAVAGFVVYKMIKKPAAVAPVAMTKQKSALLSQIKGAQFSKMADTEEDLGISEAFVSSELGSLGGGFR